jgi:hypothetical protein
MSETSDLIILLLSAANHKPGEMWRTLVCLVVCSLQQAGKSYGEIKKETGLERSTIQGILKGPSSYTTQKDKTFKLHFLKLHEV